MRLRCLRFFVLLVSFASPVVLAQQSKPTLPAHKLPVPPPPPAAVDQQQFISYWTTETGWSTELQLRNNAATQNLTVTPVLRLPDGTETSLAAVTIKPQEVKSINLDAAIPAGSPQLVGAYGSIVLRYRASTFSGLYAVAMIHGLGHSIAFHIDGTGELQDAEAGSREGIWWLPNSSASDYLVLVNKGQNPLTLALSVFDSSGKAFAQNLKLAPAATTRLSVRQLVTAAGLTGSYGGVTISAVNHAASLNTLHVLFDENAGFSAILKMFDRSPNPKLSERDYARTGIWTLRAPMLALSNPDPALAFPFGTILQPQIFLRNATAKPVDASLRFNWRTGNSTGKAVGPQLRLLPYETRLIDVAALQDGTVLPKQANWTSVTIASNALPDELLAVAASYDASLKYGAQTPFSDQLSHQWKGGMWEFDPLHDSIITAGNGGTKPTQAAFTIFYNQGAQKYELEQSLQPDEQMWIDIGKLIRESVPDKNGRTLPADLTSGSYEVRDLTNTGIGMLFEGKVIYDKSYGHVTYGCATCCGYNATQLWYDPITLLFGGPTEDDGVWGYNVCEQGYDDVSSSFYGDWSSQATSIITVDYYGTHTGVAVGSTTTESFGDIESTAHYPICPARQFNSSGGGNVRPTVSVSFSAIPSVAIGQTATTAATVSPENNSTPISLSISSGASVVSPTSTFTGNTNVVVEGIIVGTETLTATVPNPEGGSPIPVGTTTFPVTPRVDSVSPARGLVGATVSSLTINGQGFLGGHINTPAAMQVQNITTFIDTQIVFDLVISSSATTGNNAGAIYITTNGLDSNTSDFYVQVPTSLNALSSQVISMGTYCANPGNTYGILVAIHYQVLDQASTAIASNAMEPQEMMTNSVVNGVSGGDPIPDWQDVGPSHYPGTSQFTDGGGQYWDAPVGWCLTGAFTATITQPVSMLVAGTRYPLSGGAVRTNDWSGQSSSPGTGSITNGTDVSQSH